MKVWKKNLVAAAVLVTVCAGIYVNWLYTEENVSASLEDTLDVEKVMSDEMLILEGDMAAIAAGESVQTTASDYFAAVRLSRQQARDNALNLLQEAMAYSDQPATKEAESSMELEQIVQTALSEAQIESLIIAKGYMDCVAYMTGEGISVAVSSPEGGLQQEDVAVIATEPPTRATTPSAQKESTVPVPTEKKAMKTVSPVSGAEIFGYSMEALSYNQTTRDWRVHNGIDLAAEAGSQVVAAADGEVYAVCEDEALGHTVIIRHDDGYTTRYASLAEETMVKAGDKVTAGQAIGCAADSAITENALGCHVHFSVTRHDVPMDPAEFLALGE